MYQRQKGKTSSPVVLLELSKASPWRLEIGLLTDRLREFRI